MVILHLKDQPALIRSIFAGETEEVRTLLASGEHDVNYLDVERRTPLHAAAFKGDSSLVALLLTYGARVNAKDSKWYTPLHRACHIGAEDIVALLLRHQADSCARDRLWQTPLHVAAAKNTYGCVEILLTQISNPNITDRRGRTALHHAAFNGHTQIVELLLTKGAAVNACDKKDCRPLHCATFMGHVDTMESLIRNGADIEAPDVNRYAPLHVAAASGIEAACKPLLNAGAKPDVKNAYGNTPLHIACLNGHLSICRILVENGADIEATNLRGQTPLHIAAASTHGVDCMRFLLEHNADINRRSCDGKTPLHMTAIHGRFTRSMTLLDRGAVVDYADENGCTPLHIAAQCGHELLATTLLAFGADPSQRGHEGRTPLHMCCLSGYVECCRKFLQAGVDLDIRDNSGKTATHCAAIKGSVECLDLLVSSGASFQLVDDLGRTPLHYASVYGYNQCVFTLVWIGSKVNQPDNEGCSALHLASQYDTEGKCVEYLLKHKADPTLKNNKGFTPIHYAVAGANWVGLSHILEAVGKQFLMYGPQMPLTTPLHLAARSGKPEILRLLLHHFPDTNIRTQKGSTPLLLAAREGHTHCVQMLLRYGAKVGITENVLHMSPVHVAAKNGHMHCLALLLDNTEDKTVGDGRDRYNRTPLMLAVSGNHGDCVLTLLKAGVDPNIADGDNHTPLFRAVVSGQTRIVQLLITEGAKVNTVDVHGKTAFHLAAACGHPACLQALHSYLLESEATALDNQNLTALHWAAYVGSSTCTEYLLEKNIFETLTGNPYSPLHCACFSGSERCVELLCKRYGKHIVHLEDTKRRRPLHVAALMGHVMCANILLEVGAQAEAVDVDGRTALVVAAQFGQSLVADLLLNFGANLTAQDNSGNNALHWACIKNHSHTALLLLEYVTSTSVVNHPNGEGKTALHIAAKNGLVDVTFKLLETGASTGAVDCDGMTPEMCCIQNSKVAQCLSLLLKKETQFQQTSAGDTSQSSSTRSSVPSLPITTTNPRPSSSTRRKLRLRTFKSTRSQTDISLVRPTDTPDTCCCERIVTPPRTPSTTRVLLQPKYTDVASESDVVNVLFPRLQQIRRDECRSCGSGGGKGGGKPVFIVENYGDSNGSAEDEEFQVCLQRKKSDMFIAKSYGMQIDAMDAEMSQISLDSLSCMSVNKQCKDCLELRKKCASCLLKRLMKQHVSGKLKIAELRTVLKDICMTADPDYKRSLIRSLENFKNCLQERKLSSSPSLESVDSLKDLNFGEATERRPICVSYSQNKVCEKKRASRAWKLQNPIPSTSSLDLSSEKKQLKYPRGSFLPRYVDARRPKRTSPVKEVRSYDVSILGQRFYALRSTNAEDADVPAVVVSDEAMCKEDDMAVSLERKVVDEGEGGGVSVTEETPIVLHVSKDQLQQTESSTKLDLIRNELEELKDTEFLNEIAEYISRLKIQRDSALDVSQPNETATTTEDESEAPVLETDATETMVEETPIKNEEEVVNSDVTETEVAEEMEAPSIGNDGEAMIVPASVTVEDAVKSDEGCEGEELKATFDEEKEESDACEKVEEEKLEVMESREEETVEEEESETEKQAIVEEVQSEGEVEAVVSVEKEEVKEREEYKVKVHILEEQPPPTLNVEVFTETYVSCYEESSTPDEHPDELPEHSDATTPIVDGNISLVPYDDVKRDTLWDNIERSTSSYLMMGGGGAPDHDDAAGAHGRQDSTALVEGDSSEGGERSEGEVRAGEEEARVGVNKAKGTGRKKPTRIREGSCLIS